MIPPRGAYPLHWDGRGSRKRSLLNRLGVLLRKPLLAIEGLILFTILACSLSGQEAPESGSQDTPSAVWLAPRIRPVFDSLFRAFETEPTAKRLYCLTDWHTFREPNSPVQVVVIFSGEAEERTCGQRAVLMFFGYCPQVTSRHQQLLDTSGVPLIGLACRKADGSYFFSLVMSEQRKA